MTRFDPIEFLAIARGLKALDSLPEEARVRTSVGRAYYCAHLLAVAAVQRKWPAWRPVGRADDHGRVIHELRQHKTRKIAERLQELRMLREHADYHVDADVEDCALCRECREGRRERLLHPGDADEAISLSEKCAAALQAL